MDSTKKFDKSATTNLSFYDIEERFDRLEALAKAHTVSLNKIDANIEALGNGRCQFQACDRPHVSDAFSKKHYEAHEGEVKFTGKGPGRVVKQKNAELEHLKHEGTINEDPFASPPGKDYQEGRDDRKIYQGENPADVLEEMLDLPGVTDPEQIKKYRDYCNQKSSLPPLVTEKTGVPLVLYERMPVEGGPFRLTYYTKNQYKSVEATNIEIISGNSLATPSIESPIMRAGSGCVCGFILQSPAKFGPVAIHLEVTGYAAPDVVTG